MRGHHLDGGQPHTWTRWRVTAAVLTTVLAAAACTNRGGTQPPTTSIRTTGVPVATPHGSSAAPLPSNSSTRRNRCATRLGNSKPRYPITTELSCR